MSRLSDFIRRWQAKPKVRPWALAGPVIVLLICLPLLRPMRHPTEVSDDETARLETIRALVERHTFALQPDQLAIPVSRTVASHGKIYSD